MTLIFLINLLPYLLVPQMLVGEKNMIKEVEIQELKDMALTHINKGEVQISAHILMLQDIVSPAAGRIILRNC